MNKYHTPALSKEAIDFLNIEKGFWYVDCTLGGGGHTREILSKGGKVLGIDVDESAIKFAKENLAGYIRSGDLVLANSNFLDIEKLVKKFCLSAPKGILFDLGVSFHQLEESTRGFSFNSENTLDMRMDRNSAVTAKKLVNGLSERELKLLFEKYGEESYAGKIAKEIVKVRGFKEIETCRGLSELVKAVKGGRQFGKTHPATKVFQALRIAVNDELEVLERTLPRAFRVLAPKGRILVISFHSLEDRIVKNFGKKTGALRIITKKPVAPSFLELSLNPRARSAKLRVFEKILI